jgi:hypothetical protein
MSSPSKHLTPEHTPSSPISKAPKEKIDESIAAAGQQASQEANNLNRELRSPLPSYLTYSFPPPKADPTGAYSYGKLIPMHSKVETPFEGRKVIEISLQCHLLADLLNICRR